MRSIHTTKLPSTRNMVSQTIHGLFASTFIFIQSFVHARIFRADIMNVEQLSGAKIQARLESFTESTKQASYEEATDDVTRTIGLDAF